MKRWPAIAGFLMFVVLCASCAFWVMQFFKPPVRAVAAPPQAARPDFNLSVAEGLFGGRKSTFLATAGNYVLKGVVVAANPRDSVAIMSVNGKPAQAFAFDADVVSGVTVRDVQPQYAVLSESGVARRVMIQDNSKVLAPPSSPGAVQGAAPVPTAAPSLVTPVKSLPSISTASPNQASTHGPGGSRRADGGAE